MKLLIYDDNQINYYDLPETTEPYYVVNYESSDKTVSEIITLYSEDNNWTIKSDYNIKLISYGEEYEKGILENYKVYQIHFEFVDKTIKFVALPSYENYVDISLENITNITIGAASDCNISYNNQGLMLHSAEISKSEDMFIIRNLDTNNIYINGKNVAKQAQVNFGDSIFIEGLKLIWMGKYFKINVPVDKVNLTGLKLVDIDKKVITEYQPTSESEHNLKLYDYKDLFFHTPIIKDSLEERKVKIESPPDLENDEGIPMILTMGSSIVIALSTIMSVIPNIKEVTSGNASSNSIMTLVMSLLMLIVCTVFPIFTDKWQKRRTKKKNQAKVDRYNNYLADKKNEIEKIVNEQVEILNQKNLTLQEIAKQIEVKGHFVWSREIPEEDFMLVRLGTGNLEPYLTIECDVNRFSYNENELLEKTYQLASADYTLKNVPISINITKNVVCPFIISTTYKDNFIKSIILQLMFYYSSKDLKIIIMTSDERKDKWRDVIYSSHCWSDDKKMRFFATNESEINQLSMYLEQIFNGRIKEAKSEDNFNNEDKYPFRKYDQYYLIISDDFRLAKDCSIVNKIIDYDKNMGLSLLVFADNLKDLPSRLKEFTVIENKNSGIYKREFGKLVKTPFVEEFLSITDISRFASIVGNIPIQSKDTKEALPPSVDFLGMYGAGKIEHLNILSRWTLNDPTRSLNAPMGFQSMTKTIGLDLHEKVHGPHGLIAGSTGSGKSEFIISYILSMAVNYHPYEVQFVLIDYKGGGLAGAFEKREKGIKIPHLVGTITNLDKSEMHRTLVSIKSELERRQIEFNKARDEQNESTIDIYKYQRLYREGKVKKPIAHLFIISDEFAELKAQQPDFMDELISTARIGRSLGVHLILATQKPAGVVNDQIWSNSRFKVCLKVQTPEDSHEILKKPDAAFIKETGRFYLQVGNDELYAYAQSPWTGEKYIPTDHLLAKVNDSIDFIGNDGTIIKSVNDDKETTTDIDLGDQLTNTVQYLYDVAKRENIEFSQLWLPNIPNEIYLMDTIKKYNFQRYKNKIEAVIGEYDMPTKQKQGLITLDITNDNTILIGNPGSGKENLLTTMIFDICAFHSVKEVNFYILDFGAETLTVFNKMPHIGAVLTVNEKNTVMSYFDYVSSEIKRRKELLSDFGGSFQNYIRKGNSDIALMVTVLNGYENFMENCNELDYTIQQLLREGPKYGIVFVVTAASTGSIRSSLMDLFDNKILLQISDPYDYRYYLDAPQGMVPSTAFGRGVANIDGEACEFQTALITKFDAINEIIRANAIKLSDFYKEKAPEIKVMPKRVVFEKMLKYTKYLNAIPVGYDFDTLSVSYYNFAQPKCNLIVGKTLTDDIEFMAAVLDLVDSLRGLKVNVFDFASSIDIDSDANYYNVGFLDPLNKILQNDETEPTANIFIGLGNASMALQVDEIIALNDIFAKKDILNNHYFILFDNYSRIQQVQNESWFSYVDTNRGIWVGEGIDKQTLFPLDDDTRNQLDTESDIQDVVYTIESGKVNILKGVVEEME